MPAAAVVAAAGSTISKRCVATHVVVLFGQTLPEPITVATDELCARTRQVNCYGRGRTRARTRVATQMIFKLYL